MSQRYLQRGFELKECNKRNHDRNELIYDSFISKGWYQNSIAIVEIRYQNSIATVEIKQTMDIFQNICSKNKLLIKHNVFQLPHETEIIHGNKLYLQHTHWRKRFLQPQLLQICESFLSRGSKKNLQCTLVCMSRFYILKMLVLFLPILAANTKIVFCYKFRSPLSALSPLTYFTSNYKKQQEIVGSCTIGIKRLRLIEPDALNFLNPFIQKTKNDVSQMLQEESTIQIFFYQNSPQG